MTRLSIPGIFTLLLLLTGCNNASTNQWDYKGYDSTGTQIISGWIELTPQINDTLGGSWKFESVGSPSRIGPQTGTGTYSGFQDGYEITLDLNPELVDNNVTLTGIVAGSLWSGTWEYSGFSGVINHGTFSATGDGTATP